jgi:two-component system LytT family response regulator
MKLRAYLVDDETLALERLARLLRQTDRVDVIGSATDSEAAVAALTRDCPDVCFLDIHMPRLNGFEVLLRLPIQPIVIFTTAHDQYALRAFAANAVDYLLKPIELEALERALTKAERLAGGGMVMQSQLRKMIQELADSQRNGVAEFPDRIASRLGERIWFLDLARVTHFYAEDKVTFAVSDGKAYCVDDAIADLEKRLNPKKFIRIHRGTMVNIAWIREVASLPGGSLQVRLVDTNGTELVIARDRVRDVKARLGC